MLKTNLKKAASVTGNFIERHKVAIAVTGTVVACAAVTRWIGNSTIEAYEEFVTEKGLMSEFTAKYFEDPADI